MEIFEYEIRKFTNIYAKAIAENARKKKDSLEIELKDLETDLKNYQTSQKYLDCNSNQTKFIPKKANRVMIRSKSDWCESGEKISYFQALKKLVTLKV